MSGSRFDILAALVLSEEATEKQREEFGNILNASRENQVAFEKLKRVWHTELRYSGDSYHSQRERLWQRYQMKQQLRSKMRIPHLFIYRVAAVILLLITTGIVFYLNSTQNKGPNQDVLVVISEVVKETRPGERLRIRLPDGTMVHLNAGSRLVFPEYFPDSARIVYLVGEGYFDVAEDSTRPFTVKTESMDITALGTAFGVNAYDKNLLDLVALVSGKLLIRNSKNQEVRIDSGQSVLLSRGDYSFSKSDIDYLTQIAWKDGVLHFKNSHFSEIVQTLELNYGVRFTINEKLNSIRDTYTGTFKNENLDNILKVLSFSMDFKYELNGKEVLIKK